MLAGQGETEMERTYPLSILTICLIRIFWCVCGGAGEGGNKMRTDFIPVHVMSYVPSRLSNCLGDTFDENLGLLTYCFFLSFRTRVKIHSDSKMQYSHHCEHLLERLNKQREAGFLCDCTIVIGEFQFKAHRNVLASFSEYFGAIYRSTSENNVFLDQSQVKADGFKKLLEFIYTGTLNLDR